MTDTTIPAPTDAADVILINGHRAPKDYYDAIRYQVEGRLPELTPGVDFTTRQICGPGFWGELTRREQRLAGEVLKDLVLRGRVPLVLVKWAHEYPLKFRLV